MWIVLAAGAGCVQHPSDLESQGLISRALPARMEPQACFAHTARARPVDSEALVAPLRAGRRRGAALDGHETDLPPADCVPGARPSVLATREAASSMLRIATATVEAFARGERLHAVSGV